MAIPVIDFSKLDSNERPETMARIANGCEEWGFFQLVNHGIPVELLERVKKVVSQCYKVEREEGFKESVQVQLLNEVMEGKVRREGLDNLDWEDVFILQDDNEWPSQPKEFKETMVEYRRELKKLAEKVAQIMDENLGLEKGYINRAIRGGDGPDDHPFFGTKVSHYPPCPRPDLVSGLRAHNDAGAIILLFQDDKVDGLQIFKDGHWIDVQPVANAVVINLGDQIEILTNGRYKSVWHRVLATETGNRKSIATFYNPSHKATIAPAPELIEQTDAQSYPKVIFGDYMALYAKQKFQPKEPRFQALMCWNKRCGPHDHMGSFLSRISNKGYFPLGQRI